jgi:diguanylate cyclase (GGDEF)-like protein
MKRLSIPLREFLGNLFPSFYFRVLLLACGFGFVILYRLFIGTFGVSLGYFYVLLIAIAGLWFGIRGGLTAATISIVIHLGEIALYKSYPMRDLVIQGLFLRFFTFLIGGFTIGYYSQTEKRLRAQLKQIADYDELTGCTNYRFTMQLLDRELIRAKRLKEPLSLAMLDIDHFKSINDTYGHLAGNDVLQAFSKVLRQNLRGIDIAGRYGGDEFILILPDADARQSLMVLDRIRQKLAQTSLQLIEGDSASALALTFSAGIASYPEHAETVDDLLKAGDEALYQAKREGRNRTFVERRKQRRQRPPEDLKVELRGASDSGRTYSPDILNFSPNGMLASVSEDISRERNLICRIYLQKEALESECKVNVVHTRRDRDNSLQIGTSFLGISPDIQSKLKH